MKVKNLIPFSCILIAIMLQTGNIIDSSVLPVVFLCLAGFSIFINVMSHFIEKLHLFGVCCTFLCISCFILMHINSNTDLSLSLEKSTVTSVEGTLVYDSVQYKSGKNLITLRLDECSNVYSNSASARGLCTVLWDSSEILCSGCRVNVKGTFSDSLFIANSLTVTDKKAVHFIRQRLILAIRQRLTAYCGQNNDCSASYLSMQLILGVSEEASGEVSSLAKECGCLHVLALSGMHLNVVASVCGIFGKKSRAGKIMKYVVTSLFVFVAGPRPSLIRALLMIYMSFLPPEERVFAVFIVQSLLFPAHIVNLGCIYAYTSTFALLVVAPYIKNAVFVYSGKMGSSLIGSSIAVALFNAPVQILSDGIWYPSCILGGTIAGFLASASMILGFIKLTFPFLTLIDSINNAVYSGIVILFKALAGFPKPGITGYIIFVAVVAAFLGFLVFIRKKQTEGKQ